MDAVALTSRRLAGFSLRSLATVGVQLLVLFSATSAWAQPSAEDLFKEGKAKMDVRDFDAACPKFEASYLQSQIPGALLSWADCEEARGHLLKAVELWTQALERVKDEPNRVSFIEQRLAALRARIPKLKVVVARTGLQGVAVSIDGKVVQISPEGIDVDLGRHEVAGVTNDGQRDTVTVELASGETKTATLFAGPEPGPRVTKPPAAPEDGLLIAGWVIGGVGVAGLLGFGGTAIAVATQCKENGADPNANYCPQGWGGVLIANAVLLGVGSAALGTGVIMLAVGYTRPKTEASQGGKSVARLVPGPGEIGAGLELGF